MVDGAKMSKSLGNLYTLADLEGKGFSPMAVRYALISGHYRSQLNFTLKSLDDATAALEKIEKAARKLLDKAGLTPEEFSQDIAVHEKNTAWGAFEPAWIALCDDLNIPGALGKIFSAFAELNKTELTKADAGTQLCGLAKILSALGIKLFTKQEAAPAEIPAEIVALGEQRWAAKQARNWAEADALRNRLAELGWKSLDRKDGYSLEKI
jgi:cysteinyl-tRNA synthetase